MVALGRLFSGLLGCEGVASACEGVASVSFGRLAFNGSLGCEGVASVSVGRLAVIQVQGRHQLQ